MWVQSFSFGIQLKDLNSNTAASDTSQGVVFFVECTALRISPPWQVPGLSLVIDVPQISGWSAATALCTSTVTAVIFKSLDLRLRLIGAKRRPIELRLAAKRQKVSVIPQRAKSQRVKDHSKKVFCMSMIRFLDFGHLWTLWESFAVSTHYKV